MSTQCQCCNPPVLVSCGKQETVVPKLSKDEGDQFLSSILGDDSTNNAAPDESVQHLRYVTIILNLFFLKFEICFYV